MEAQGQWAQGPQRSELSRPGVSSANSGTEAIEAAIKLARLHTAKERYKIITFEGGFPWPDLRSHDRDGAAPSTTRGLGPLMAGFVYAPYGDLNAVAELIDAETAAILIEPIQGEGGITLPPEGFLAGLRNLADEHDALLIFDEVQTGCGRTGQWFAYQHDDVAPDVMTLAKGICGGLPGGGDADDRPNRAQPSSRHACLDIRRQSDCGPSRIGNP